MLILCQNKNLSKNERKKKVARKCLLKLLTKILGVITWLSWELQQKSIAPIFHHLTGIYNAVIWQDSLLYAIPTRLVGTPFVGIQCSTVLVEMPSTVQLSGNIGGRESLTTSNQNQTEYAVGTLWCYKNQSYIPIPIALSALVQFRLVQFMPQSD